MLLDNVFARETTNDLSTQDLEIYLAHSKLFSSIFTRAVEKKFSMGNDPCMNSVLHLLYSSLVLQMKNRSRILMNNACALIGVIDDKGILAQGEVFV